MHRDKKMENIKEMLKYLDNRMRGYKYSEHPPEGRIEERENNVLKDNKIIENRNAGSLRHSEQDNKKYFCLDTT